MREINKLYDNFGHSVKDWGEAIAQSKATYGKFGRVKLVFTLPDSTTVAVSKRQIEKIAKQAVEQSNKKFTNDLKEDSKNLTGITKKIVHLREKFSQLFGKSVDSPSESQEDGFDEISLAEELEFEMPVANRGGTQSKLEKALNEFTDFCLGYDIEEDVIKDFLRNCKHGSPDARLALELEKIVANDPQQDRRIKAAIRDALTQVENNPSFTQATANLNHILKILGD